MPSSSRRVQLELLSCDKWHSSSWRVQPGAYDIGHCSSRQDTAAGENFLGLFLMPSSSRHAQLELLSCDNKPLAQNQCSDGLVFHQGQCCAMAWRFFWSFGVANIIV
eukprot:s1903_g11.t1